MIDLRSDTVTRPTDAMRAAMASAEVGDDVYGDDPTVRRLEERTAALLGKEDAVFVPTGSMSNQIAIRTHTEPGDLVLVDAKSHIVRSEGGAAAAISGVTLARLPGVAGVFTPDDVRDAVGHAHRFNPPTLASPPRLLCAENTHNAGGGTVWPVKALRSVAETARELGLGTHLDGARLWHASAASGVSAEDFAAPFDTVNVCFSKGLGAPIGSALAGPRDVVTRARRFKQQLGGGFRQAGIVAAGALHALEHHRGALAEDVRNARAFAEGLAGIEGLDVHLASVQSNIVRFEVASREAHAFVDRCHERGVHMLPGDDRTVRAVLHRDVDAEAVSHALDVVAGVAAELVGAGV